MSKLIRRLKRDVVRLGEKTVKGVGLQRRARRRSGNLCEDTCEDAAALNYRTYVDTARAKRETV